MNSLRMKSCKNSYVKNLKYEIEVTKCGEIFTTDNETFNLLCTYCGTILENFERFTLHFKANHNKQFEDDVEIKIEELSNDDTLADPMGQCMDAEDCIEALESASIVNLESIIKKSVDTHCTIEVEDKNNLEGKSNDYLGLRKKSNSSNKSQKKKRRYIPKLHVCDICNKACKTEIILKSHIKYDHTPTYTLIDNVINSSEENQKQDRLNLDSAQSLEDDPRKCRYCDRRFSSRGNRFEHECLHTGERPYKCTICGKTFRVENSLKMHLRIHENKREFKCDVCGNGFNSASNLRIHLRRHNNEKPHKCSYCDKRFVYTTEKLSHESIHTGEKPFQCTECGQQYSTNNKLGAHIRKKHVPRTPVKCENCDKTFKSKERLKEHQVVHNKDYRPYKCDICDATFQRRYAFSEHKKLHSDEFRYTCNICGKGFKQFAGLYSHKKSHGENLAFQKSSSEKKF